MDYLPESNNDDDFKGDPDITGIGVILAFLIPAWFTLFITTVELFSKHTDDYGVHPVGLDTVLKRYTLNILKCFIKPRSPRSIRPAIRAMSDQQLITGIALISVGYIQHNTISQYHFYIIYFLGFACFQAYGASLRVLKGYADVQPMMKLWRVMLMTIFFGMLVLNSIITYNWYFLTGSFYSVSSMRLVWAHLVGDYYEYSFVFGFVMLIFVLVWGYLSCIMWVYSRHFKNIPNVPDLFWTGLSMLDLWVDKRVTALARDSIEFSRINTEKKLELWYIAHLYHITLSYLLRLALQSLFWFLSFAILAPLEILSSHIINIWRIYSALLWATIGIVRIKTEQGAYLTDRGREWGFGQILPLFLLILPIMSVVDEYQAASKRERQSQRDVDSTRYHDHEGITSTPQPPLDLGDGNILSQGGRLRREDTEAGVESQSELAERSTTNPRLLFRDRMFGSEVFCIWVSLCALAAFGVSTSGTITYL
ncbi:hypothetical protein F5Y04DRAFT_292048 [Hypomontagnella monticulosa]|nr:hypothetical protein F5Y04DRAFT_292048 [Hypomontagnella monticulosa]